MNYQAVVEQLRTQKILVVGELMLDVYISGTSNRIAREAPVPIVSVTQRENMPGGAANAACNLAALGVQTTFLTVTGEDREAQIAITLLNEAGVDTHAIIQDPSRETISKRRVLSDGQLLVRFDAGSTHPLSSQAEAVLIHRLSMLYSQVDAILISDYGYGVITQNVIAAIKMLDRRDHKLLVVDSGRLQLFRDLKPAAVKPNYNEAIRLLNLTKEAAGKRVDQILLHGRRILDITGAAVACVTIDREGAVIFEQGKTPYRTYARPVPNSKAAGAGDTYIGALTAALSLNLLPLDAAEIAASAAAVVVSKDGTAVCSSEELIAAFRPPQKVIHDRDELAERVQAYREQGRKIIFTNGCFDILHRGHTTYLARARDLGDLLIVAVNSDDSVRRLKGPERPVNSLEDRMAVLAALDSVDHVVGFDEPTPAELIRIIKPDIFVKGGDYTKDQLPEAPVVEALGGQVEILPYIQDRSTTDVINRIRSSGQVS